MESRKANSNRVRTDATKAALIEAARRFFIERGYAGTATPDVVVAAGVTRGALYHHFVDKRDLFRHVLVLEAQAVREAIDLATPAAMPPADALLAGGDAYLDAMTVPGRTRLLLVEGPAVLGVAAMRELDDSTSGASLAQGLCAALGIGTPGTLADGATGRSDTAGRDDSPRQHVGMLAPLLSAAFDRASLEIDGGADPVAVRAAMRCLLDSVLRTGADRAGDGR